MNDKMDLPPQKAKSILIIALMITVVILLLILIFRQPETKVVYQTAPSATDNGKSRNQASPYVQNEVHNTIAKKWKEMNACYKKFLASTPAPEVTDGVIAIDWQVNAEGEPISPELVSSQINHPVLENCLISKIETWRFPPPPPTGRNAYVLYKFNFKKTE